MGLQRQAVIARFCAFQYPSGAAPLWTAMLSEIGESVSVRMKGLRPPARRSGLSADARPVVTAFSAPERSIRYEISEIRGVLFGRNSSTLTEDAHAGQQRCTIDGSLSTRPRREVAYRPACFDQNTSQYRRVDMAPGYCEDKLNISL